MIVPVFTFHNKFGLYCLITAELPGQGCMAPQYVPIPILSKYVVNMQSKRCTQAGIYFKALFTTAHIRVHLYPTGVRLKCNFHLPMRLSLKKRDSSPQPFSSLGELFAYVSFPEIFRCHFADFFASQNLLKCQQDLHHLHWRHGSLGDATTSADNFSVL